MANGASKIFKIMQNTSKAPTSKALYLTVKSLNPLNLTLDDRLIITENFCIFDDLIDKTKLSIGDVLLATTYNDGQLYLIHQAISSEVPLKNLQQDDCNILFGFNIEGNNLVLETQDEIEDLIFELNENGELEVTISG